MRRYDISKQLTFCPGVTRGATLRFHRMVAGSLQCELAPVRNTQNYALFIGLAIGGFNWSAPAALEKFTLFDSTPPPIESAAALLHLEPASHSNPSEADYGAFEEMFTAPTVISVPEPSAAALIGLGALLLLNRNRTR
jgi:hypothetical protein